MPAGGGTGGTGPSGTGFTFQDAGGCNCPVSLIEVLGCINLHLGAGMTVSVYTASGGTLLFSGTTDASGYVYPPFLAPGTWYVTVTGQPARFAAFGANVSMGANGSGTAALSPAAGYTCLGTMPCPIPASTTLKYTGPKGPETLTWNGSAWQSADGVVMLTVGNLASNTQILYNGGLTSTTCSSYACPTATSLSFFDGSTVTE